MAENRQKIKLIKLYELLRKETDEDHPISRVELCKRLNEMGISSNVRTLSLDIEVLTENGFEIESFLKDKEKFYYVPEHELTIMDELGYDVELTYEHRGRFSVFPELFCLMVTQKDLSTHRTVPYCVP